MTAILFDLDGTLLDTLADLTDATNYALAQFGYPSRTLEEVRRAVGNGAWNQIRRCLPEGMETETVDRVLAVYKPYYTAHCRNKTKPYDGIGEVLEYLKTRYPVAIVSNKPDSAVKELCAQWFPGVYALGETPDCPRKPAPDMVFKAMKDMGAKNCIYIGDSEVDVLTAQNADVPCVCVLWGFRDKEDIPASDHVHFCEETEKLIEIIEELIHGQ